MAREQAPEPAMDRATFAVVMGALGAGVYMIIAVAAHELDVDAGPLPIVIAMLVVGSLMSRCNSRIRARRHPEHRHPSADTETSSIRRSRTWASWGRWGLNPRPTDYESAALTG